MDDFDYIVVGGGSAGCVVAARLSADPANRILLIEAGETDSSPLMAMPGGLYRVLGSKALKPYEMEPGPGTAGRRTTIGQPNVLGGGSSVNGMIYIRGQALDYDHWAQLGNRGWSYADVLPVFRALENNQRLNDAYHGNAGELRVSDPTHRHPLGTAFVEAMTQIGYPRNDDFNGANQEGVGFYQTTTYRGRRWSAVRAFLDEARRRPNLRIITSCQARRILFEDRRAAGVVVTDTAGHEQTYRATSEIVLTAGALNTPKLLMLSGVGPAQHLCDMGIEVVADLPGVGQNFQDHTQVTVQAETNAPISLFGQDRPLHAARHLMQYYLFRSGLMTSNIIETGAFVDSTGTGNPPDLMYGMFPVMTNIGDQPPIDAHGFTISAGVMRPRSRGSISLRSKAPDDPIRLYPGSLDDPHDVEVSVRGIRIALRALEAPAFKSIVARTIFPEPQRGTSDRDLADYCKEASKTMFHPVGTAKMGPDSDPLAVTDDQLRVRGVHGLRVCDASAMPTMISGNTNATTIMMAERCSRMIRGAA